MGSFETTGGLYRKHLTRKASKPPKRDHRGRAVPLAMRQEMAVEDVGYGRADGFTESYIRVHPCPPGTAWPHHL